MIHPRNNPIAQAPAGAADIRDGLPAPESARDRRLRAELHDKDAAVRASAALELAAAYAQISPHRARMLLHNAAQGPALTAGRALLRLARMTGADERDEMRNVRVREYLDQAREVTAQACSKQLAPDRELLTLRVDIAAALAVHGGVTKDRQAVDEALNTLFDVDRKLRSVGDPDRLDAPADEGLRELAALVSLRLGQIMVGSDVRAADAHLERAVTLGNGSVRAHAALERGWLLEHHTGGLGPEIERQYMLAVDIDDPVATPLALLAVADILWESGRRDKARTYWTQAGEIGDEDIVRRVERRLAGTWQREKAALAREADARTDYSRPISGVHPPTQLGRMASGRAPDAPEGKVPRPVIVVGAGTGGHYLLPALAHGYRVVGFVDDDTSVKWVRGIPVLGDTSELVTILEDHPEVEQVIFAIPTAPGSTRQRVFTAAHRCEREVVTLPSMFELRQASALLPQLRPLEVRETYGDRPWYVDRDAHRLVLGRRVAIVGASTPLGAELARRVAQGQPRHLLLVDEPAVPLLRVAGDIRYSRGLVDCDAKILDYAAERELMEAFEDQPSPPDVLFYCGGVDIAPEGVLTHRHAARANLLSADVVARVAARAGCHDMVVASTDRAGHRASSFDMTKALAEAAALGLATESSRTRSAAGRLRLADDPGGFRVSVLRTPNLWAPNGAVVGRLTEQLSQGGPLRIKAGMKRRFVPAWEAAQAMLRLLAPGHDGGLFAMTAGDDVEIRELAERLLLIHGLTPTRDIRIETSRKPDTKASLSLWGRRETPGTSEIVAGVVRVEQDTALRRELERRTGAVIAALEDTDRARGRRRLTTELTPYESIVAGDRGSVVSG